MRGGPVLALSTAVAAGMRAVPAVPGPPVPAVPAVPAVHGEEAERVSGTADVYSTPFLVSTASAKSSLATFCSTPVGTRSAQ